MVWVMLRSVTYCGYDVNISFVVGEKELKEYSKQLYISLWLLQAEEYEEEIDVEYEQKAALASLRISIGRYEKLITNRST
jgi:hypothetical protein